jgi:hypothetical protein
MTKGKIEWPRGPWRPQDTSPLGLVSWDEALTGKTSQISVPSPSMARVCCVPMLTAHSDAGCILSCWPQPVLISPAQKPTMAHVGQRDPHHPEGTSPGHLLQEMHQRAVDKDAGLVLLSPLISHP